MGKPTGCAEDCSHPEHEPDEPERYCLVPSCVDPKTGAPRPEEASGLCYGHRWRKKRGLPLDPPLEERDLSPFERVMEVFDDFTNYGDDGKALHSWRARLRAACWDWLHPGDAYGKGRVTPRCQGDACPNLAADAPRKPLPKR